MKARTSKLPFELSLLRLLETGYWFCSECGRVTERVEREQGLPAKCLLCGGVWLEWRPPVAA